jgi:hypothetical protein
MAWRKVDSVGRPSTPTQPPLGPYRELAVPVGQVTAAALWRPWRESTPLGLRGFMLVFSLGWNAITWPMVVSGLLHGSVNPVFVSHPLVGIGVAYFTLALWLNRTTITVDRRAVTVTRGPLKWPKAKVEIPRLSIDQLYVEEYVGHEENDRPVKAFRVMARMQDGEPVCVDKGMYTYEHARALEDWIERELGVKDVPVDAEVPKVPAPR